MFLVLVILSRDFKESDVSCIHTHRHRVRQRWLIQDFLLLLSGGRGRVSLQETGYPFTQWHNQSVWVHSPDLKEKLSRVKSMSFYCITWAAGQQGGADHKHTRRCKQFEEWPLISWLSSNVWQQGKEYFHTAFEGPNVLKLPSPYASVIFIPMQGKKVKGNPMQLTISLIFI